MRDEQKERRQDTVERSVAREEGPSSDHPGRPEPLIELHTHLEGAVTPARLIQLAEKYGQPGLPAACLEADGSRYRSTDFAAFLELFKHVTLMLRSPADFHAVALDLGEQLAADGVVYAEVTVAYGVMQRRQIDPRPVQRALHEAAAVIAETVGVVVRWLPDAVRQWGLEAAWPAWEAAATCGRELGVVGFGLGGDETSVSCGTFAPLFADVRIEGLGVTIHAGEAAGPESVRQAIELCFADRIGHAVSAAADPLVMALLAARRPFLELCPGSNVVTGAIAALKEHPLAAFLEAGLSCCLNTDDRAIFELDLRGEYQRAADTLGLSASAARRMQEQAVAAAFDAGVATEAARLAGILPG